jgi:hypothetical protein
LAGFSALDVALAYSIRRERAPLGWRVALELADVAFWSAFGDEDPHPALAAMVASELEAGSKWGAWGLAVPMLATLSSTAGRLVAGRRPQPSTVFPHVAPVLIGLALRHQDRTKKDRALSERKAELSARRASAYLAGQHAVAMSAGSAVDQLLPVSFMLGDTGLGPALRRIRTGLKADLAEQSREHAIYLATAARLWEMAHNDHPDLRGYVEVSVQPDHGTALLSALQASTLAAALEARQLSGVVTIAVAVPSLGARPGQMLELLVNGQPLVLPASPSRRLPVLDPLPPVLIFAAWSALTPARRQDAWVPLPWALVIAASYGAVAWYRHSEGAPRDPARELADAVALAVAHGVLTAAFARNRHNASGTQLFPLTYGIAPAAAVLAINWQRAHTGHRWAALAALAATAVAGYWAAPPPRSARDLARSLAWPAAALVGCAAVVPESTQHTVMMTGALEGQDEAADAQAYQAGRQSVLRLVRAALAEADDALQASLLSSRAKAEAGRRLDAVRSALAADMA